jgi:hypothetical protein
MASVENIKLSAIRDLSPTLQRYQSELAELDYEANPTEGSLTKTGIDRLLEMHPIGVMPTPSGDPNSYTLVFGLRSFQIAACSLTGDAKIRVQNLGALSEKDARELSIADIVIGCRLYAKRADAFGLAVPIYCQITERNELKYLESLIFDCATLGDFARFVRRSRQTLYDRHRRLIQQDCAPTKNRPRLTSLGIHRLLQMHPIGISESRPWELLFGWRTAKIVVDTLPTTDTVECLRITVPGKNCKATNQIADMLIGNHLYSFSGTSIASMYRLHARFTEDNFNDDLTRLAYGIDTVKGFAEFCGLSHQTFHYRASPTAASQLNLTLTDVRRRIDQANE